MKNKFGIPGRRTFLKQSAILTGSALPWFTPGIALAQTANAGATVHSERLADKVLLVQGPDSNVLVVDSSEGLVMVDGGHADWFGSLHAAIDANFPGRPYRALINTHWHRAQSGSNESLGEQGVEIIAHENTMLWQSTEVWQRWSDTTFPPLPSIALAKTTVFEDGSLQLGDRNVHYGHMRNAHTDGDIWVYFEQDDVLATGPLVSNGRWPEIDWSTGGYIGAMLDSFVSLLTVPTANTRIVPAYGDVMTLEELRAQNQMYLTIFDRLHGAFIKSASLDDILLAKPTAEFDASMGDPTRFLTLAFESFQGHVRDPQNFRLLNIP